MTNVDDLPGVSKLLPLCDRCGEEINPGAEQQGVGDWDGCTLCPDCWDDVLFEQQEENGVPF